MHSQDCIGVGRLLNTQCDIHPAGMTQQYESDLCDSHRWLGQLSAPILAADKTHAARSCCRLNRLLPGRPSCLVAQPRRYREGIVGPGN